VEGATKVYKAIKAFCAIVEAAGTTRIVQAFPRRHPPLLLSCTAMAFVTAATVHISCLRRSFPLPVTSRASCVAPNGGRVALTCAAQPSPSPSSSHQKPEPEATPARSIASASSSAPTLTEALTDCASKALVGLVPGAPPDVAMVFVSARYAVSTGPQGRSSLADVAPRLRSFFPGLKIVFGSTGEGVVGDGVEIESRPAVSLTLLRLPGVRFRTFHIMDDDVPSLDASQADWRRLFGNVPIEDGQPPSFVLLSDPAFAERGELNRCLTGLDFAYPGCSAFGSVASAGAGTSKGPLICSLPRDILGASVSCALRDSGLVGLSMSGDVEVDCMVTQSCKGIGPTFEVRKVEKGNVIVDLEQVGRAGSVMSAAVHLRGLIAFATPVERTLMQTELHIGFAQGFDDEVGEDDYVACNILDIGQERISLSCQVRPGQVCFCHVLPPVGLIFARPF
jgi:small ligand-binding sensory domain FIST